MANIRDIAEHTGLSTATVSRYLNKRPYVSKEAQLAIELAMEQLHYHPNSAARSLRSGKTRRIAVVIETVNHPFYSELLAGFCDVAWRYSYDVLVQQSGAPEWSPSLLLEQSAARSMDGLIMAAETREREAFLSLVHKIPIVACDQAFFDVEWPHVYIDHYKSATEGLEYLHRGGATVIACICDADLERTCSSDKYRRKAYRDFGARSGAPVIHEVPWDDDTIRGGHALFEHIMALSPRPDAVFAGGDDPAVGLLAAAREAGVVVPSELAILGFDDHPAAEVFGISTIRQPVRHMGRRTMEILMRLINDGIDAPVKRRTEVKYELITRTTA